MGPSPKEFTDLSERLHVNAWITQRTVAASGGENNGLQDHTGQDASGFFFHDMLVLTVKLKGGYDKLATFQNWSDEKPLGSR